MEYVRALVLLNRGTGLGFLVWITKPRFNISESNTQDIFKSSLFELVQLMYTFLSHFPQALAILVQLDISIFHVYGNEF